MKIATQLKQYADRKQQIARNRGLSLTETLLVLGVIALIAVIAYAGYNAATGSVKTGGEARQLVQLMGNINKTFATSTDYVADVTQANVVNAGLIPKGFRVNGTNVTNAFGGTIVADGTASQYGLITTNIPSDQCVEIAQSVASAVQEVAIIASPAAAPTALPAKPANAAAGLVKSIAAPQFNIGAAVAACSGAAPKAIVVFGS